MSAAGSSTATARGTPSCPGQPCTPDRTDRHRQTTGRLGSVPVPPRRRLALTRIGRPAGPSSARTAPVAPPAPQLRADPAPPPALPAGTAPRPAGPSPPAPGDSRCVRRGPRPRRAAPWRRRRLRLPATPRRPSGGERRSEQHRPLAAGGPLGAHRGELSVPGPAPGR